MDRLIHFCLFFSVNNNIQLLTGLSDDTCGFKHIVLRPLRDIFEFAFPGLFVKCFKDSYQYCIQPKLRLLK